GGVTSDVVGGAAHAVVDRAPALSGGARQRGLPAHHRDADGRGDHPARGRPPRAIGREASMTARSPNGRPWTFYALAAFFTLFVLFLYGPMSAIFILSFQGPTGGLTFPMNGV